ncbi:MAG: hypothetical protein AB9873_20140 [Syntrophobacteraceae bacterium]
MRTPSILASSLLAVISVVLGGCAQILSTAGSSYSDTFTFGLTESMREQAGGSLETVSLSPVPDGREARAAPLLSEERLFEAGDTPVMMLADLSRDSFLLGECGEARDRERLFSEGRRYAERLVREQPERVEGHYWLAMNLAGLAGNGGAARGLSLLPVIVRELETAVSLDETYDQAGAHRTLGRVYFEAPSWPLSEGDLGKSLHHLRAAVRLAPENVTNHLYLAEILAGFGRYDEADRQLQLAVTSTQHAVCDKRLQEDFRDAARLKSQLGSEGLTAPIDASRTVSY